ncbi:hypothetical protein [Acinetobacter populi]|uniref:Uncharacterized protein n=1 Tax=Acinetobacter populi TaxID=1582270 RepID=A0A1Z9YXQ9_9GAMM|nr:hypothetical protein [Acinetobacter populi]OUY06991.1 hypothetical protein CAP51_09855 [Acinetobacter populi]
MKININFDWAFITSVFTIFLYWCGYWYNYGYIKYFEYSINAFDIPIPSMVMDGLLVGIDKFFSLIMLFLLVSLIASITLTGWKKILLEVFSKLTFFFIFLYYLIYKHFYKKTIINDNIHKNLSLYFRTIYIINVISKKIKINNFYISFNKNIYSYHKKNEENLIYEKFQFSFILHYLLLIFLLIGTLKFFDVGSVLIYKGEKAAQESFLATIHNKKEKKFPKVNIKDEKSQYISYYLTDICLKGSCLVTDIKGNSSIHDAKEIKVIH